MRIITIIILFSLIGCKNENIEDVRKQYQYSKADLLFDLEYLKNSLVNTHIDVYAHTTKETFEENFLKVKNQIKKDSFSELEAIKTFQEVVSVLNNGHTRISFPIAPYSNYLRSGGTVFPLEVAIEEGKILVRKNWSTNTDIKIEDELISINGVPMEEVLEKIYSQISAERRYFENAQLENLSLPRYFWLVYGEQKEFEIEVMQNQKLKPFQVDAVKAIEDFEMKRDDIIKHDMQFQMLPLNIAYLRPGDFGGDLEKYQKFIDSSFQRINEKRSENLIVDLRNHSGGEDAFSDYLVSYIADKPFKWNSKFELRTSKLLKEDTRKNRDTSQAYWNAVLSHSDGEIYQYNFNLYQPQPKEKRFQGKVYALVNRQSYSQSTVTAAQLQDYGFATIVGEETAEYPNLYASIFNYELPKTGIRIDVPKGKIYRISGIDNGLGVIPDIEIKDHLLDENDEILDGILTRIRSINE